MTDAIPYILLGAVLALTIGSAAAVGSARQRLKQTDMKPRAVAAAVGELMVAWTGVSFAIVIFYLLFTLARELEVLISS